MTVAVFAGAISFGALVTLPQNTPNPEYSARLLAVAANLFTCCMFVAMGIPYILRKEPRDEWPPRRKALLCQIHVWAVIGLLMAGFAVLNVLIIQFGQMSVCIAGNCLLALIPFWFIGLRYGEKTEWLGLEIRPQRHIAESNPSMVYTAVQRPAHA
jgi:hypothetical protein